MADAVAPVKTEKPNTQVNGTIPTPLHNALEDYRWENRIDKFGKIVALALEEFATNHGITVKSNAPAKGDSAKA